MKTLFAFAITAATLAAQVCTNQPRCAETNSFAAVITDFRSSTAGRYKVVTANIRFQNKLARPIILGFVAGSGITTDDQGNRYTIGSDDGVRGIGLIANNRVDPKFLIQPGQSGDTRIEMAWGWNGRDVFGLNFEMEFTVREMGQLPSGQFKLGPEHPLRFQGLANGPSISSAPAQQPGAAPLAEALGGDGPVMAAATPAPNTPAAPPAPAIPQGPDPCLSTNNCFNAGPFAADVQNISSSFYGGRHHILKFNVRLRNVSVQPLILAYTYGSAVTVDESGRRYAPSPTVSGIGIVNGRSADPQLVLNPGQSKLVAFDLMRRNSGTAVGLNYTLDLSLEQLEILPSQQVRSLRQFSLNFPNMPIGGGASRLAPGATQSNQNAVEAGKKIVDLFKKK